MPIKFRQRSGNWAEGDAVLPLRSGVLYWSRYRYRDWMGLTLGELWSNRSLNRLPIKY